MQVRSETTLFLASHNNETPCLTHASQMNTQGNAGAIHNTSFEEYCTLQSANEKKKGKKS